MFSGVGGNQSGALREVNIGLKVVRLPEEQLHMFANGTSSLLGVSIHLLKHFPTLKVIMCRRLQFVMLAPGGATGALHNQPSEAATEYISYY